MNGYVVLTPPDRGADDEGALIVRDGFSLPAFLVPLIWFLWHRMWWWAAGYLVVSAALGWAIERTGWSGTGIAAALLLSLFAGLEGPMMRVRMLERRGWTVRDMVAAFDRDDAERIYYAGTGGAGMGRTGATARPPSAPPLGRMVPRRPGGAAGGPALGLFDQDERR